MKLSIQFSVSLKTQLSSSAAGSASELFLGINPPLRDKPPLVFGRFFSAEGRKKIEPQNALKRSKMRSKRSKSPPQAGKFWRLSTFGINPPLVFGKSETRGGLSRGIPLIRKIGEEIRTYRKILKIMSKNYNFQM